MTMLASAGDALNPTVPIMISNSLMGILIVFCVLIFISFIISLFKYLPGSGAAKPKAAPEVKKETAPQVKETVKEENLAGDDQLVAVITAAIYAYESSVAGVTAGSDPLIVRSIRRVR
ncbi:MAG: OadG family protein [Lachnospiraceae bacterium]|nr:OadG family protein [Lachnospiraceae bacterium]